MQLSFRILLATAAFCVLDSAVTAQSLVFRGSDTLGDKMVPKLADAFVAAGNNVKIDVKAEGSSAAFKALLAGEADIGMSSRPIKDTEKAAFQKAGMTVREHVAGVDMIAVIVNEANTANDISVDSVGKIFTSAVTAWKTASGAKIMPYTRNESSGTFKVFQKLAMDGADYGKTTMKMEGNGEIAAKVAADPGGVGYVGLSYANAPGVKALKVNGVSASPKNAATYPLSRKLYYYTIDGKTGESTKAYLAWATSSPDAGKIVTEVGFIPVK